MVLANQILILVGLVMLSAFFSASETALISLSNLKIEHLIREKRKGIELVKLLKERPNDILITILIGNNIVNIGAAAFATTIALGFFESNAIGITTGIMTFIILTFGEILPKNLALHYDEQFSVFAARPIYILSIILYPVIRVYDLFNRMFEKEKAPLVTEEEIKSYVTVGQKAGEIKEIEREFIHRIFRFDDVTVREIMTPKPDMTILNAKDKLKDHISLFIKTPFSRVPVYIKTKDKIIGVIHLKDVLKAMHDKKLERPLKSFIKPIFFVPETKKIDKLLRQFQLKNQHIAIAVDEHGIVTGLITLEDVLEEIVGEIQDETDISEPDIVKIRNRWEISGKADINKVNKELNLKLKEHSDFETFGGFIIHELGRIPKQGETIKAKNLKIKIIRKTGQRILDTSVKKI